MNSALQEVVESEPPPLSHALAQSALLDLQEFSEVGHNMLGTVLGEDDGNSLPYEEANDQRDRDLLTLPCRLNVVILKSRTNSCRPCRDYQEASMKIRCPPLATAGMILMSPRSS